MSNPLPITNAGINEMERMARALEKELAEITRHSNHELNNLKRHVTGKLMHEIQSDPHTMEIYRQLDEGKIVHYTGTKWFATYAAKMEGKAQDDKRPKYYRFYPSDIHMDNMKSAVQHRRFHEFYTDKNGVRYGFMEAFRVAVNCGYLFSRDR